MSKPYTDKEAFETIKEWGVDVDNFVTCNYRQTMCGGDPSDNSIELGDYFMDCLRIVTEFGIETWELYKKITLIRDTGH